MVQKKMYPLINNSPSFILILSHECICGKKMIRILTVNIQLHHSFICILQEVKLTTYQCISRIEVIDRVVLCMVMYHIFHPTFLEQAIFFNSKLHFYQMFLCLNRSPPSHFLLIMLFYTFFQISPPNPSDTG